MDSQDKTARDGPQIPRTKRADLQPVKEHSQLQADRKQPSVGSRSPGNSALNKIVETTGVTERAHRPRQSRQRLKLGSSAVAVHRQDPCLDAEATWIQRIVEIPQLQYTDENVDISTESSEDRVDAAGAFQREAFR